MTYAISVIFTSMTKHTSVRQAVGVWLAANEKTQTWLAVQAGIAPSVLSEILNGDRPFTKECADKLKGVTRLNLKPFISAPSSTPHAEVRS